MTKCVPTKQNEKKFYEFVKVQQIWNEWSNMIFQLNNKYSDCKLHYQGYIIYLRILQLQSTFKIREYWLSNIIVYDNAQRWNKFQVLIETFQIHALVTVMKYAIYKVEPVFFTQFVYSLHDYIKSLQRSVYVQKTTKDKTWKCTLRSSSPFISHS